MNTTKRRTSGATHLAVSTFRRIQDLRKKANRLEGELPSQIRELNETEFGDYVKLTEEILKENEG